MSRCYPKHRPAEGLSAWPNAVHRRVLFAQKLVKVFGWLRERRRSRWKTEPLSPAWRQILQRHAAFYHALSESQRAKLVASIHVLVAEKYWEGCRGLAMTDEVKVTVAAHASRLTLGLDDAYFDRVKTVLVYPEPYMAPSHEIVGPGIAIESQTGRAGEAWHRGPVILSWSDVLAGAHGMTRGRNVVLHEFAHQLDLQNGPVADGVPVIESPVHAATWIREIRTHYDALCWKCEHAQGTVLDCYGTKNLAEFFAVASEVFFELPGVLRRIA